MKQAILILIGFFVIGTASAQKLGDILKQEAGQGAKQGAAVGTEKAADKALGRLFGGKKKNQNNSSTQSQSSNSANKNQSGNVSDTSPVSASSAPLQTYSKFDFVPGAKVLAYDDFSKDAIGDYPADWNTNSGAEVVTVSGTPGHWLMINKKGSFMPEYIKSLPDNFTIEFDLMYVSEGNIPELDLFVLTGGNSTKAMDVFNFNQRSGVRIGFQPIPRDKGGMVHIISYDKGENVLDNQVQFQNNGNNKIKVSIWRQKQRVRVYMDQNKVLDLPRAFPADKIYNMAMFYTWMDFIQGDKFMIGNIKLAVGDPDTRNKLMTEGKFSTTGILFDVNSAKIKPESYGSLKAIADVLNNNSSVRVKIVGNTDSDGDASANMTLSKKRADAVKVALVSQFGIDASRLDTDGKGASNPVAPNTTPEGKAQNRRVDFIKL